jgi:hypothetical protein
MRSIVPVVLACVLVLMLASSAPLAQGSQPAPEETPETTPETTPESEAVLELSLLLNQAITPPIHIDLPRDWLFGYDTLLVPDLDGLRPVPFALYTGPVDGGQGFIVLLWGFPNITSGSPASDHYGQTNLWIDGLRLLRLVILEQGCNIGTDLQREYPLGDRTAAGTQFAAIDCPELPDTRGWFAGTSQSGVNFLFYMYTDPIEAMDGTAPAAMQAILDTVRIDLDLLAQPEVTPEAAPEATATP